MITWQGMADFLAIDNDNDNDILFNLLSYRVTFMMRMINCDKMLSDNYVFRFLGYLMN